MTGFFRGPGMLWHVLIVGIGAAISVPALKTVSGSFWLAIAITVGLILVYAVAALFWASRR